MGFFKGEKEMQYRAMPRVAYCIACGCDDYHACPEGCWWLEVDRSLGVGVCSECESALVAWNAGVRSKLLEEMDHANAVKN